MLSTERKVSIRSRGRWGALLLSAVLALPAGVEASEENDAKSDMTMPGGVEGTVFDNLTISGEDRVRIEFERPDLEVTLDPRDAPGLEWGDSEAVIARSGIDFVTPVLQESIHQESPYLPRPWLNGFRVDSVARFRPAVEGVSRWRLVVADSRADTVAVFDGKGQPPKEIVWDGASRDGSRVPPGITCSYVLEAYDKAGNHRNFVGQGFQLPAYRSLDDEGGVLLFSGAELTSESAEAESAPPLLLETASWINQYPATCRIEVRSIGRTHDASSRLGEQVAAFLGPRVLGDDVRILARSEVRPDAPELGSVEIRIAAADEK